VFKKIFALALILILVAICTRRPLDGKLAERLPDTCNAAQFAGTVSAFEELRLDQSLAVSRVESTPIQEPLDYAEVMKREQQVLRELQGKASAVREPRCLGHAKELFLRYLQETSKALALRGADKNFSDYRRARESAETIRAQYASELKLQEKNRQ